MIASNILLPIWLLFFWSPLLGQQMGFGFFSLKFARVDQPAKFESFNAVVPKDVVVRNQPANSDVSAFRGIGGGGGLIKCVPFAINRNASPGRDVGTDYLRIAKVLERFACFGAQRRSHLNFNFSGRANAIIFYAHYNPVIVFTCMYNHVMNAKIGAGLGLSDLPRRGNGQRIGNQGADQEWNRDQTNPPQNPSPKRHSFLCDQIPAICIFKTVFGVIAALAGLCLAGLAAWLIHKNKTRAGVALVMPIYLLWIFGILIAAG